MGNKIRVGIAGAAGYTGGELIRILLRHPEAEIVFAHSKSNAGKPVSHVHRDLAGETELIFDTSMETENADVLFLCTGHGESKSLLESIHHHAESLKIIDLSQDFRLEKDRFSFGRNFIYGLPELNRAEIRQAGSIANPGCFATAIQLALLPLAHAGLLGHVHVTGITGATGAGQSLQQTLHFPWRVNNISAYKTLTHQHLHEIRQSLEVLQPGRHSIYFIPWRGDFARGIFVSCVTPFDGDAGRARQLYEDYYRDHPFTIVSNDSIDLKQVVNTNKCLIYTEYAEGQLVVHAAIDNLLKGASGQAVQNMNLMFGINETAGLLLKSVNF